MVTNCQTEPGLLQHFDQTLSIDKLDYERDDNGLPTVSLTGMRTRNKQRALPAFTVVTPVKTVVSPGLASLSAWEEVDFGPTKLYCFFGPRKPDVHNFSAHNSRAGDGRVWNFEGGGGFWVFGARGGSANFIFMGTRIFLNNPLFGHEDFPE